MAGFTIYTWDMSLDCVLIYLFPDYRHIHSNNSVSLQKVLHVNNQKQKPYGLTAFQVNTWLQQKSTNSNTLSPWLEFTCNTSSKTTKRSASGLPSYVLGGGMLPVPENDIPI